MIPFRDWQIDIQLWTYARALFLNDPETNQMGTILSGLRLFALTVEWAHIGPTLPIS